MTRCRWMRYRTAARPSWCTSASNAAERADLRQHGAGPRGWPAVLGVKLAINVEQAAVVNRIFTRYREGMGRHDRSPPERRRPRWSQRSVVPLHDSRDARERTIPGIFVWGRTAKARNPETGQKVSRPIPESKWRRVDVPEWRIVAQGLWDTVQERRKQAGENFHQIGGMTRTA